MLEVRCCEQSIVDSGMCEIWTPYESHKNGYEFESYCCLDQYVVFNLEVLSVEKYWQNIRQTCVLCKYIEILWARSGKIDMAFRNWFCDYGINHTSHT